jgi:hypothetical protein
MPSSQLTHPADPDVGEVTLRRVSEIERGEGPPPTAAEREALAKVQALTRRMFPPGTRRRVRAAERIYQAASPSQKRRLLDMTFGEIVAEHRAAACGGRSRGSTRSPRRRSVRSSRAKARAPADPDSDPFDLEPALRVISLGGFRRQLAEAGL